ncbi:hypothetical protein ASF87_14505 [Microbacterium sp. Leaf161]|uniref:hypothetical protein n=1 Tax=Microbacterium sp. Leaf161 TaxID=1736281 RepID=UPI0006F81AB9|nr:hypothetical protein [Microbacterium sp. Leaf161]KQR45599.1 hypothetical protein ASF87_14505 [Microbacterium sp. Leaf161]
MKEDFLRPPRSLAEWSADSLRVLGIVGVGVALIWLAPTDAGIAALALPALMLPRVLGLRGWFDLAVCATVLVAAWSNIFDLYRTIPGWDLVVHLICTGILTIVAVLILTRAEVVAMTRDHGARPRTPLVLAPLLALALSAMWEMVEWLGWAYLSDEIFVTYQDTIGDMVFGGLGGIAAGVILATSSLRRPCSRSEFGERE